MQSAPQASVELDEIARLTLDRHMLDALVARGAIGADLRQVSLGFLHPPHKWAQWCMLLLLFFGTGLVLSGIVFFFAFNWIAIPDLAKLAMIEAALVLAAVSAWYLGPVRLTGRLMLLGTSVLTGVLLAVAGQIYQSGADPWQLFALWALFITPWTLLSSFLPLWLLWLGLLNLALNLWWADHGKLADMVYPLAYLCHIGLNGLALGLREGLLPQNANPHIHAQYPAGQFAWLSPPWSRWLLVACLLVCLFPIMLGYINHWQEASSLLVISAVASAALSLFLFVLYRYIRPDLPVLAMLLLMACLLLVIGLASFLHEDYLDILTTTILCALVAITCFGAAAAYLRRLIGLGIDEWGKE